jgi:mono/diheme cytochrome c family protein
MLRFRPDGSEGEVYARGLRNAVGFDWRPDTGELYATDNGRDLLGDDFPPCELNRVVRGGDYGWPVANGRRILDPDLGPGHEARAAASLPPAFEFPAHNAPLGIRFLRTPGPHAGTALVALHGSWNRTRKDGYKVVALHWREDGGITSEDFLWGFLEDDDVIGRPVDVTEGPDGTVFVSDGYAGVVYRIARQPATAREPALAQTDPASPPERPAAELALRGEALYESHDCAGCHEIERAREGVVPVPLDGLADHSSLEDLTALLGAPPPPMPSVPLSREQRRELAAFLLLRFPGSKVPESALGGSEDG